MTEPAGGIHRRGQVESLTPEALEDFLSSGVTVLIPHGVDGRHELRIDPVRKEFTLRSPADGTYEDTQEFENIEVELDESGPCDEYVLTIVAGDSPDAAYTLAHAIVRQTDARTPYAQALTGAVDQFRSLLRSRRRLSPSQEIGLMGELALLRHLFQTIGPAAAVGAWLGHADEENDFKLPDYDVEVKTTLSERRRHVVHGLGQLSPAPGRDLYVISLQFTAAGRGAGESLTQLAHNVLRASDVHLETVRRALEQVGWRESDAGLYAKRYTLRSTPRCYLIDDQFPAITRERIELAVPNSALVEQDVSYPIDVTPLPYGVPGPELQNFVEEASHE